MVGYYQTPVIIITESSQELRFYASYLLTMDQINYGPN